MPKLELSGFKSYPKKDIYIKNSNNDIYKNIYNTHRWRTMRLNYLMRNPICEKCKKELSTEVHHKTPISSAGDDLQLMYKLGFDIKNLMALCNNCHKEIHYNK